MFAMPALLSVYPDALFVQTHRTPVDAMASVSSLVTILRSAFSDAVDPATVCREAIGYWSETMDKFLNERDRLARKRIATSNMTKFRATPSPQSGESTTILAGLCRNRQRSACAPWSQPTRRGNLGIIDII